MSERLDKIVNFFQPSLWDKKDINSTRFVNKIPCQSPAQVTMSLPLCNLSVHLQNITHSPVFSFHDFPIASMPLRSFLLSCLWCSMFLRSSPPTSPLDTSISHCPQEQTCPNIFQHQDKSSHNDSQCLPIWLGRNNDNQIRSSHQMPQEMREMYYFSLLYLNIHIYSFSASGMSHKRANFGMVQQ